MAKFLRGFILKGWASLPVWPLFFFRTWRCSKKKKEGFHDDNFKIAVVAQKKCLRAAGMSSVIAAAAERQLSG